ncbi:MAG: protein kinase [Kofleriaceae bacterium]
MARLIDLGGAPVNEAERFVIKLLLDQLPADWSVIPNASLPDPRTGHAYEYDAIVVGDFAIFVVEIKGWRGVVHQIGRGDWQLDNGRIERNPLPLADQKARVLATHVKKAMGNYAPYVQACLIAGHDDTTFEVFDTDSRRCLRPSEAIAYLTDPKQLPGSPSRGEFTSTHDKLASAIAGHLQARRRVGRRYGSYVATKLQHRDDEHAVFLGKHALLEDSRVVRIRAWYLSEYQYTKGQRTAKRARLMRSAQALAQVGNHPHIATLRDFGEQDGEFFEVTDWSESGTLTSAFVRGGLGRMPEEHKVQIIRDLAEALEAARKQGVYHRALDMDAVLLEANGRAKLTGFDLAFLEGAAGTVYGNAAGRDMEFAPPELRNPTDYEVFDNSDLYSLAKMALLIFPQDAMSPDLVALLERCAADDPSARPTDPAVFLEALDVLHGRPTPVPSALATPTSLLAPSSYAPGETIDGVNVVVAELGRGSGSIVYRVLNEPLGSELALKLIVSPAETYEPAAEYKMLKSVESIHVPRAHWMGRIKQPDGTSTSYLLLDLIAGDRLSAVIERGPVELDDAFKWVDDLLDALSALHHAGGVGVLHRDVKPENIVIGPRGAVLVDFGTAKPSSDAGTAPEGTLRYTPPDLSSSGWAPHADVFAVACVLYMMLTGAHPWPELPSRSVVPTRVDALRPDVPAEVANVIELALGPEVGARFADAESLRRALLAARTSPTRASVPPPSPSAAAPLRTTLAAVVEDAGTRIWTATRIRTVTRHPDLAVALANALNDCIAPWASESPAAARDALLESEARASALEAPLPEAMPQAYDVVASGLAPAQLTGMVDGESTAWRLTSEPKDRTLWFDALHFTEWTAIRDAARVLARNATVWAWTHSLAKEHAALSAVFEANPANISQLELPRGDRSAIDLGALMKLRRQRIEDEILSVSEGAHRIWIVATSGLIYLGHGLRRDVGEGQGDRADAARAAWSAAFPVGRNSTGSVVLPSRVREPLRSIEGRRYPVGRLAWPDAPGTTWLQAGGLSLPERVLCLFRLNPGTAA